ncbi:MULTISPECIES: helix-turn-helix domain-containing protein [Levilactobacillus]|jgi:transcriptional regulator with XRE-family HTH domain|uniref:helix-turn-helix domain-containing protein n=1 Tax=Levilactobacillus TaxID=2767886 RepID=UPI00195076D0|nr:helix-turn-helix transcriptional regulator [Levilactobacillus sp. 244-2]
MASTELGARLKKFRQTQQLTQTALADQLHVSRQTVSSWETGRNQPDIATITQLATLYAVPVDNLLQDTATVPVTKPVAHPNASLLVVLFGVLLVERVTQFSTFPALYWMDFLILLLIGLMLNLGIARRHPNTWTKRIHWIGLTVFAALSLVSGSINAFNMGFGLMTTCQFSGLVVIIALIRKCWQSRSTKVTQR